MQHFGHGQATLIGGQLVLLHTLGDQINGLAHHLRGVHREQVAQDDEDGAQYQVPGVLGEVWVQLQ